MAGLVNDFTKRIPQSAILLTGKGHAVWLVRADTLCWLLKKNINADAELS